MSRYGHCLIISTCLLMLAVCGCGGGSQPTPGPPQVTGPFSNASVRGNYAFSFSGASTSGFFAVAGSFQANGAGNLTSGAMDINSGGSVLTNVSLTGTYNVTPNGQGTATLVASGGPSFNLHIVVITTARLLIARLDTNASGHGAADLQDANSFSSAIVNSQIAYRLFGVDGAGNPLASAGGFTTDATGALTAGVHDVSDNGSIMANQSLGGAATAASAPNGRGTLTLNTSLGTLHFAFYVVMQGITKLVEIDPGPSLTGETSNGSNGQADLPGCGPCVLVWNGVSNGSPFAAAGSYSVDGKGGIFPGSIDVNNGSTVSTNSVSGTYSFVPQFRGVAAISLNGVTSNFAIYPMRGIVEMLQIDPGTVVRGMAFNDPFAGNPHRSLLFDGPFGFNFLGMSISGQPEQIGQITNQDTNSAGSGPVAGFMDVKSGATVTSNMGITGDFTLDGHGVGSVNLQTTAGTQRFILHATSNVLFVSADPHLVVAGAFEPQMH